MLLSNEKKEEILNLLIKIKANINFLSGEDEKDFEEICSTYGRLKSDIEKIEKTLQERE